MCGNLLDFIIFDDPIIEVLGLEQVDWNERFNEWILATLGFPIERRVCVTNMSTIAVTDL